MKSNEMPPKRVLGELLLFEIVVNEQKIAYLSNYYLYIYLLIHLCSTD
jgi:hypothetical protein